MLSLLFIAFTEHLFFRQSKKTETLMDVTKTRESLSLSYLIIRSKYLLLSPYRIYPEEFCLPYLCQHDFLYTLQLGALAVLGVSIWILVDQPSFLKVLDLTDEVVGGFQVN